MTELSDSVKEKLNNPNVIKKMAEHILLSAGQADHSFCEDRGYYYDVMHYFKDLPNRKIQIYGRLNLVYVGKDSKYNMEMGEFLHRNLGFDVIQTVNLYADKFEEAEKDFSVIRISWDDAPLILNINNLKETKLKDIKKQSKKTKKRVFRCGDGEDIFEPGEWQEYLAKIYVSTLGENEYFKFEKGNLEFLL